MNSKIKSRDIINLIESLVGIAPKDLVTELLNLYPTKDFKQAVLELAAKYKISALDLVGLYMKFTGTLETELPDNYSLKSFKTVTQGQSQSKSTSPKRSSFGGF